MLRDTEEATVLEEEERYKLLMKRTHVVKEYMVKDIHTEWDGMYDGRLSTLWYL